MDRRTFRLWGKRLCIPARWIQTMRHCPCPYLINHYPEMIEQIGALADENWQQSTEQLARAATWQTA